ncbi:LacI family DNA-binding transcriptional regulator [Aurantibacter crassamenti]|uniref:LacI family DNA-binding transcriptional regulator n=1 Tax=Aurantibacter crassamenti TaxID=1837375 RepID=UPI00193A5585|nr:LacI family DNA-binding transcriptional regulator [Aurantibacter crassamenti]MBM1106542.1 LacI family DNA-binding transcriptional regulator [Aurantibacter crassamenti]
MRKNRITMIELAKILNVSTSTISRALKDHHSIGEETREKIKKTALNLGYIPNSVASNLRRRKTNHIGVIVPRIDRYFHSSAISGIEEVANEAGYYVSIFQTKDSYKKEVESVEILMSNKADGIIACLALETSNVNHYRQLANSAIPLVLFDRVRDDLGASKVLINDYDAAFKACDHLAKIGCKKIAHIAGNLNSSIFKARLEGYKAALLENNITIDEDLILYGNILSKEEGHEFANQLLDMKSRPDGVFCANDLSAASFIQTALIRKVLVPSDIAVIGFSNTPISNIINPALTTIDDHAFEMGQASARLLIKQIENNDENIVSETIIIRNELIVRESTVSAK